MLRQKYFYISVIKINFYHNLMKERNYKFDYIRTIAVITIVICHYLMYCGGNTGVGRFLAGGGNSLFFVLSALLYGLKWKNENMRPFQGPSYLIKRLVKLASAAWPFLLVLTILFIVSGEGFTINSVILNFLFLGYLSKLPGNGHLWFMTIMMCCYLEFVVLSKYRLSGKMLAVLALLLLVLYIVLENLHIPAHALLSFAYCAVVFCYADKLMAFAKDLSILASILMLCLNGLSVALFLDGIFDYNRIWAYMLTSLCGFSWLVLLLKVVPAKGNRFISYISSISFEIYLVHHTLCAGPFVSVSSMSPYFVCQFGLLIMISLFLAHILHLVSETVSKSSMKTFKKYKYV